MAIKRDHAETNPVIFRENNGRLRCLSGGEAQALIEVCAPPEVFWSFAVPWRFVEILPPLARKIQTTDWPLACPRPCQKAREWKRCAFLLWSRFPANTCA